MAVLTGAIEVEGEVGVVAVTVTTATGVITTAVEAVHEQGHVLPTTTDIIAPRVDPVGTEMMTDITVVTGDDVALAPGAALGHQHPMTMSVTSELSLYNNLLRA